MMKLLSDNDDSVHRMSEIDSDNSDVCNNTERSRRAQEWCNVLRWGLLDYCTISPGLICLAVTSFLLLTFRLLSTCFNTGWDQDYSDD